jgi:hypothetical protein
MQSQDSVPFRFILSAILLICHILFEGCKFRYTGEAA